MCGINGLFAYHYAAPGVDRGELRRTRDAMRARGPDGAGEWFAADDRVALGHRRLAIIDLDTRADQPMVSHCGRHVLVYNGEIYNYAALRLELQQQGVPLRTQSDTEVLLALYARDGTAMFRHLRGMYALGLYDLEQRCLLLARDPHGIKPLYVADDGWTLRFASSVRALEAGGAVGHTVEPAAEVGFLLLGSVPEPWTWLSGVRALPAGHWCRVDGCGPAQAVPHTDVRAHFMPAPRLPLDTWHARVRTAVADSVRAHQVADVPVGVFLSAGIDSGALLGLAATAEDGVHAVTLGFDDPAGDEARAAAQVAAHYAAQHHIGRIEGAALGTVWSTFLDAMDQPSIDGLNTWLVSRVAAAAGLKVVLSGVGGDELFAGYPSFLQVPRLHRRLRWPARIPGVAALGEWLGATLARHAGMHPKAAGLLRLGRTLAGCWLLQRGVFQAHELHTYLPAERVREGLYRLALAPTLDSRIGPLQAHPLAATGWLETCGYLRNQLLRDTDWAGMAHGLEIRTPLVDVRLSAALAPYLGQATHGAGKQALAAAPHTPLPESIRQRAKTGFTTPLPRWLQTLPDLSGWQRWPALRAPHTPWARRQAVVLLEHFRAGRSA